MNFKGILMININKNKMHGSIYVKTELAIIVVEESVCKGLRLGINCDD